MNVGYEDDELKFYVELFFDYKDFWWIELMVFMGYIWEEIQDLLVGQRYNEVMVIYLFLGYKSFELEGDIIILKFWFLVDLINSSVLFLFYKVQCSVLVNFKQWCFSDQVGFVIFIFNFYFKKIQSNNVENKWFEEDWELGWKVSSIVKVFVSFLFGLERKKIILIFFMNSVFFISIN